MVSSRLGSLGLIEVQSLVSLGPGSGAAGAGQDKRRSGEENRAEQAQSLAPLPWVKGGGSS